MGRSGGPRTKQGSQQLCPVQSYFPPPTPTPSIGPATRSSNMANRDETPSLAELILDLKQDLHSPIGELESKIPEKIQTLLQSLADQLKELQTSLGQVAPTANEAYESSQHHQLRNPGHSSQ